MAISVNDVDTADKDVSGQAVSGRAGATRRAFLSASAVTAVTVPLLGGTAVADNVQFGLRAIDRAGHRSPAAFPTVVST